MFVVEFLLCFYLVFLWFCFEHVFFFFFFFWRFDKTPKNLVSLNEEKIAMIRNMSGEFG